MADNVTLVTGASGFLGKAVMKLLAEQKQRAIGLDPRPSATTQVVDDLSDRSKLVNLLAGEKVTHIIHAGGVSGPMVLADNPVEVMTINVLGSLNLLYAAMDAGVTTFIYCSSAAALGSFHIRRSTRVTRCARTTLTARRRRRWKWCYAACGARFRSISARCASP